MKEETAKIDILTISRNVDKKSCRTRCGPPLIKKINQFIKF